MKIRQTKSSRCLHPVCSALMPVLPLNLRPNTPIRYRKGGRIRRGHIICLQSGVMATYTVEDYKGRMVTVPAVSIVATERHNIALSNSHEIPPQK